MAGVVGGYSNVTTTHATTTSYCDPNIGPLQKCFFGTFVRIDKRVVGLQLKGLLVYHRSATA